MFTKYIENFVSTNNEKNDFTEENLKLWESELCYNGYSVAFHTLWPLHFTSLHGAVIFIDENNKPQFDEVKLKVILREKIIKILIKIW